MPDLPPPEFVIGQRVRVVPSPRHRTLRTGEVERMAWHHKDGRYNYYLAENGRRVHTRYLAIDLEPAD